MIEFLEKTNQKHYVIKENPTAEIIAKLLFDKGNELIGGITKVTVWETPNSYAIATC